MPTLLAIKEYSFLASDKQFPSNCLLIRMYRSEEFINLYWLESRFKNQTGRCLVDTKQQIVNMSWEKAKKKKKNSGLPSSSIFSGDRQVKIGDLKDNM